MPLLPASASADARRLILTRSLRGLADGMVSVLLPSYLLHLGYSPFEVSAIATGTLLGSAALTLGIGLIGHRLALRRLLLGAALLMLLTGLGFAGVTAFLPLLLIAIVGTLNPSAGDVSVFLPTEQALLADAVAAEGRTTLFAWYNVAGSFAGALGALLSGVPVALARRSGTNLLLAERSGFLVYAAMALAAALVYRRLSTTTEVREAPAGTPRPAPLARSRRVVLRLAALFCIDSFGGGFIVQLMLALWLYRRFSLSVETTGSIFFCTGLLGALSQLVAARLAARIGLVETMVYTHLPANLLLIVAAFMPTAPLTIGCLLLRTTTSQMDVPARQSFVMSVVPPEERAAASSVTNVPRSLAAALSPLVAGALLQRSNFGWPLLLAGALKVAYDLALLASFRTKHTKPSSFPG